MTVVQDNNKFCTLEDLENVRDLLKPALLEIIKEKYNTLILCYYDKLLFNQIKVHQIEILDKHLQVLNFLTVKELVYY